MDDSLNTVASALLHFLTLFPNSGHTTDTLKEIQPTYTAVLERAGMRDEDVRDASIHFLLSGKSFPCPADFIGAHKEVTRVSKPKRHMVN